MNKESIFRLCTQVSLALLTTTPALGAIQISGNPVSGAQGVVEVQIVPDSSQAIYSAELDAVGLRKLYRASTGASGTQLQINSEPVAGGDISTFTVAPDGAAVVYIADLLTDNAFELFSASTTVPGSEVKLNQIPDLNEDVVAFQFVPNSNRVLFRADLDTDNEFELYSAVIGMAGTQIRLTNDPVTNGDVESFQATSTGARAVYLGDLDIDNVRAMYSAPIDAAGMQIKISTVQVDPNLNIPFVGDYLLTPNGARAIYRGALDGELYSAPTDVAGMEIKLNISPIAAFVDFVQVAPNGSRVTYTGGLQTVGVRELFSSDPSVAASQVKLNNTPVAGGNIGGHVITPDSTRVVFTGDMLVDGRVDIFSAPIGAAGGQIQLNTNTVGGNAGIVGVTPDSSRIVYAGAMITPGQVDLYSASTTATGTQLTLTTNSLGGVGGFGFGNTILTPDGSRVVYNTVYTTQNVFDLYSAPVTAAGTQVNLSNLSAGQNLGNFLLSPDSKFVVYNVDTDGNFSFESLFAADLLGQNPPVQLNDPLVAGGQVNFFDFFITPDSQTVIYIADQDVVGEKKLYAAALPSLTMGVPGDYNNDGKVDAADYTTWRKNELVNNPLPNDDGVTTQAARYDLWRANFGQTAGSGASSFRSGSSAVPEPSTVPLAICAISAVAFLHAQRRRSRPT